MSRLWSLPQRWGAIEGGLVLQIVDPQQGRISLAVANPGEGPGEPASAPLVLDQTEARRAKKKFFGDHPPPPPSPFTPLSQGLDPALSSSLLRPSYKI